MKVVIDTNVFVSSIVGGLPKQVVECWFDGRITLCLSEPIVEEYQRVLREVGAVVGGTEERVLIEAFASGDGVLYVNDPPAIERTSADPDDDKFLECALELGAEYVISGDAFWSSGPTWAFRLSRPGPSWSKSVKRPAGCARVGRRRESSREGWTKLILHPSHPETGSPLVRTEDSSPVPPDRSAARWTARPVVG